MTSLVQKSSVRAVTGLLVAFILGFGPSSRADAASNPPLSDQRGQPNRNRPGPGDNDGQPEVWLCAGERIADLLRPDAEWPFVKQHLSGIKLYVDQINQATPEHLAALARLAKEDRYQVAVELGGCLDFAPMDDTAGEWSARHELAKIEKFYAAGGQVDFLDLDGPIRRLIHPENRRDRQHFDSIERAADELADALRLHQQAHPKTKFWLLTNFPNWGYRGEVSYHARGLQRQDYGDYDEVIRVVLRKLRAAEIPLAGVTVDNPYDYLMGAHSSVNLKDPKSVDWLQRVRKYEDFAREHGLEFNLIVNSERGGQESDELFYRETLQMVDTYRKAGGRPTRWFVQSWYPYPKHIVPETAPHTMTALVKGVIEQVRSGAARGTENSPSEQRQATTGSGRIALQPQPGAMQVTARVPGLHNQAFALGIPETIGCREAMLVNFPEARIEWQGPDAGGVVSCSWGPGGRISYSLRLIPAEDYVDLELTIRNHTEFLWHDVFAFNCLNPVGAANFKDWKLERTYMRSHGQPLRMAQTTRVKGHMPTVGFYLPERIKAGQESVFVRGFSATSSDRTDGSWIVTLSEPAGAYMAATAMVAEFLFDNLDRCCIHAAPAFGDIGPSEASTTVSRLYLAKGSLDDFLKRLEVDNPGLAARQKWARPSSTETVSTNRGHASTVTEGRTDLAKWDDAATHRPQNGPGGTAWDSHYRSFIQTDESAVSKGFPTHAEAARAILADAVKAPENLLQHQGWVLFIKHFSKAYRPESATAHLKQLYENLVDLKFGGAPLRDALPFEGDARLTIHRDVVYGRTHPDLQKLDAYLVKSDRPTPVVIEIHGGGWRRGSKSQFVYRGDLIGGILDAGISLISIDYRLTPRHIIPAQMDDVVRAVKFVRSKAKEWNLDPNHIAAVGGSAGAHLAAWVALHDDLAKQDSPDPVERLSSRLTCFVTLSGPMDLTRVHPAELARQPLRGQDFANAFTAAFGCTAEQFEQDPDLRRRIREASPLFLVSEDDPPAFVMGTWAEDLAVLRDPPVPPVINDPHSAWHLALLADAMRKVNVPAVMRLGPEVGKDPAADTAAIVSFLRERLGNGLRTR